MQRCVCTVDCFGQDWVKCQIGLQVATAQVWYRRMDYGTLVPFTCTEAICLPLEVVLESSAREEERKRRTHNPNYQVQQSPMTKPNDKAQLKTPTEKPN